MLLTVSHAKQLNLPPRHFRASLVSSPSHKYNKCRCMLLRLSSYKHNLVKYQINKLSTYKIKKFQFHKWVQLCLLCCALWSFFLHIKMGINILLITRTFTNVAGPLDLPMYKRKTEETLKIPWSIPYWFASIIRSKKSMHWPIFEAGFGGITNSWSIKAGHINAVADFKRHSDK